MPISTPPHDLVVMIPEREEAAATWGDVHMHTSQPAASDVTDARHVLDVTRCMTKFLAASVGIDTQVGGIMLEWFENAAD